MHFDDLKWQIPSVGMAIAAGVIVAASRVEDVANGWGIGVQFVRGILLAFGALLLLALTLAHFKFRIYQEAAGPQELPSPPFDTGPSAGAGFQFVLCLMTAGMFGLSFIQFYTYISELIFLVFVISTSIFSCWYFERKAKSVREALQSDEETDIRQGE